MILLTGVTGRIGRAAAEHLLSKGTRFRGLARSPEKAADLQERGMELVTADLNNAEQVEAALEGITTALLVIANNEAQYEQESSFAAAAERAGVDHLVKISSIEAGPEAEGSVPRLHYQSEQYIQSLDMHSTMLRPSMFCQNLLMSAQAIANTDSFTLPLAKAKAALIDARDVGEIAGRILLEPATESKIHALTGPELMDFHEVAARMSDVLDRDIRYIEQSLDDFHAYLGNIIPNAWHVDAVTEIFRQISSGAIEIMTHEAEALLGREPTRIDQFIVDHARAFSPPKT